MAVLIVGIGFVALLTGAFAQRFLAPEIAEIEEELEEEKLSAGPAKHPAFAVDFQDSVGRRLE